MALALILFAAALFCLVRSLFDFRARRYGWATAGLLAGLAALAAPIPEVSHTVAIDPPESTR